MATINSIYDVVQWSDNKTYNIHDPSIVSGYARYASVGHTVTAGGSFSGELWEGLVQIDNNWYPEFMPSIRPTYPISIPQNPNVRVIKMGDGYENRLSPGINSNLLKLELDFNGKTYQEILAITHFLDARKGKESFYYSPPPPFSTRKLWVCREWTPAINFFGNYSIKATFEEVPN